MAQREESPSLDPSFLETLLHRSSEDDSWLSTVLDLVSSVAVHHRPPDPVPENCDACDAFDTLPFSKDAIPSATPLQTQHSTGSLRPSVPTTSHDLNTPDFANTCLVDPYSSTDFVKQTHFSSCSSTSSTSDCSSRDTSRMWRRGGSEQLEQLAASIILNKTIPTRYKWEFLMGMNELRDQKPKNLAEQIVLPTKMFNTITRTDSLLLSEDLYTTTPVSKGEVLHDKGPPSTPLLESRPFPIACEESGDVKSRTRSPILQRLRAPTRKQRKPHTTHLPTSLQASSNSSEVVVRAMANLQKIADQLADVTEQEEKCKQQLHELRAKREALLNERKRIKEAIIVMHARYEKKGDFSPGAKERIEATEMPANPGKKGSHHRTSTSLHSISRIRQLSPSAIAQYKQRAREAYFNQEKEEQEEWTQESQKGEDNASPISQRTSAKSISRPWSSSPSDGQLHQRPWSFSPSDWRSLKPSPVSYGMKGSISSPLVNLGEHRLTRGVGNCGRLRSHRGEHRLTRGSRNCGRLRSHSASSIHSFSSETTFEIELDEILQVFGPISRRTELDAFVRDSVDTTDE